MSQQDECEDDIWDYKPLRKKRKSGTGEGPATTGDGPSTSKKGKNVNNDSKKRKSVKNNDSNSSGKPSAVKRRSKAVQVDRDLTSGRVNVSNGCAGEVSAGGSQPDGGEPPQCSGGDRWCPICQMPFSILVVQTQRWHVTECLDAPREDHDKECPDGFQCTSTIPSHYRRYSHTLLAHSRASGDPVCLLERQTPAESSLGGLAGPPASGSILDSSQDSAVSLSSQSNLSASPVDSDFPTPPPTPKVANGLLLLRSPGPADFKKRKGWSSTSSRGSNKSTSSSQGSKTEVSSTPKPPNSGGGSQASQEAFIKTDVSPEDAVVKTDISPQGVVVKTDFSPQGVVVKTDFSPQGGFIKADFSPDSDDDEISYSPLSKFPEEEEEEEIVGGSLLHSVTERESDNDSLMLFSDDELFGTFADDLEAGTGEQGASPFPDNSQVDPGTSSGPGNQGPDSAAAAHPPSSSREESQNQGKAHGSGCLRSPQSKVLDRLRQTLSGSIEVPRGVLDEPALFPHQDLSSSQSSLSQASQSVVMAPRLGQSQAGKKQTDIGVFFGLKPLKEKEEEEKVESAAHSSPAAESSAQRRGERRGRRGRSRAVTSSGVPHSHIAGGDTGTMGDSQAAGAEEGVGRGGRPAGRRRAEGGAGRGGRPAGRGWSRWSRDGEPGDTRQCPFYKKIPGTKFAIDAFNYGVIEGISSYFLTHFHSDHYGGLKKSSTVPIYCNRITGNLVMSKLKVSEQYVHILPMNVQMTVDSVRVTLLDANHCPGSAMLLFMLPDGQTVLHTGDFRADPSMETYPEILSCKVQTLYLDTTYCSPEYTFPTQDKVISFAVNTAFEAVTLAPRTLVVCGSYSVGKEKVFLALAEVLGSRVCLSRDKYNTMCCLESDHIRGLITTDGKAAQVHVLPMMKIGFKHLQEHLSRFSAQYDQLLAFKPTGWTFSQKADNAEDIQPWRRGNITIYGVPYSEHSSFVEMKRFVQWLQPIKVIATVNVGSYDSRRAMEKCFSDWLREAKTRPPPESQHQASGVVDYNGLKASPRFVGLGHRLGR